jgi:hypothetical protein
MAEQEQEHPTEEEMFRADIRNQLANIENAIHRFDQRQKTIMVGWNSFIEHAGMHLNNLFRGKVPPVLLRKLLESAFRDEPKHAKTEGK